MKLRQGAWDGAQPRRHVLKVLRDSGVQVLKRPDDFYCLVDCDGDRVVVHIPNPVVSEVIAYLYRRFGHLHDFEITDLIKPKRRN